MRSPLVYVDLDAVPSASIETPAPRLAPLGALPSRPAIPRIVARLESSFLEGREAMQAEIERYLDAIRDAESDRRRDLVRMASTERMAAAKRTAMLAHETFSKGVFDAALIKLRERLEAFGAEVAPKLADTVALGYYPNPRDQWGVEPTDPMGRKRWLDAKRLWAEIAEARIGYDADADLIMADAYAESDTHLTRLLAELEVNRELQGREFQLSASRGTAELVREESEARRVEDPPRMIGPSLGARLEAPRPTTNRPWPAEEALVESREALRKEAALFAKLRGGTLADRPSGAEDLTDEFVRWRSRYRQEQ